MVPSGIIVTVIVVVIIMLVIWGLLLWKSRRVNLTHTPAGEKPQWMRTAPPPATLAATEAGGEGITLYDHDKGEIVAAPFVEQIEDILRSQMSTDPDLRSYDVDFGTGTDGGLEIRVGDQRYADIKQIPDERLRAAIGRAIATYNQGEEDKRSG
ncbi:MAG: hypothetical protein EHM40_07120 [Chloroflexi bacterium]|nr:MAG: hypothetical protein EHM40_07120 [Chloroflexota bacterium]